MRMGAHAVWGGPVSHKGSHEDSRTHRGSRVTWWGSHEDQELVVQWGGCTRIGVLGAGLARGGGACTRGRSWASCKPSCKGWGGHKEGT